MVNANESSGGDHATASFEISSDGVNYTTVVAVSPHIVSGSSDTAVTGNASGLTPGATYHYRVKGVSTVGATTGADRLITMPFNIATLSSLTVSAGTLSPGFDGNTTSYSLSLSPLDPSLVLTPTVTQADATVKINGVAAASGQASVPVTIPLGSSSVSIVVTAQDGLTIKTYIIAVTRVVPPLGNLDLTFNGSGIALTPVRANNDMAYCAAQQNDGKLVVGGTTARSSAASPTDFALVRYNADGSLDNGFGAAGKAITIIGQGTAVCRALVIQPDGKILAGGYMDVGGVYCMLLVRYNSDGSLDSPFGVGGWTTTAIGSGAYGMALALQQDGHILLAGSCTTATGSNFALVRYLPTGRLDSTFGSGGKMVTDIGGVYSAANDLVIQDDGKIVVVGYARNQSTDYDFAMMRYRPDGSLDSSFGSGGKVITQIGSSSEYGRRVALQKDGKLVLAGYAYMGPSTGYDAALVRYKTDGTMDTSFGTGGKVITAVTTRDDYISALRIQEDQKIVVAGTSTVSNPTTRDVFATLRYNPNGSRDGTFGTGGQVLTPVGTGSAQFGDMIIQRDGKIVVVGGGNGDFAVVRYEGRYTPSEIVVQMADGTDLLDGDANPVAFGDVGVGGETTLTFTVKNIGISDLNGLTITKDGAAAAMFAVSALPADTLALDGRMPFTVRFRPAAAGVKTAALHIASNDPDESPFDILLSGNATAANTPAATTLAVSSPPTFTGAVVNGSVNAKGISRSVVFDYGLTKYYGNVAAADEAPVSGSAATPVHALLSGLLPHAQYHYRVRAFSPAGTANGADLTFTTANQAPSTVSDTFAVVVGCQVTLPVLSNDADPDGDTLSLKSLTSLTPATAGTVVKSGNLVVFTPSPALAGFASATFGYTVVDAFGGAASSQVTLTPVSTALDKPSQEVPVAGMSYRITPNTSGRWSVKNALPWVTVSRDSDTASYFTVTVQANAGKADRSGTLAVGNVLHHIHQAGVQAPVLSLVSSPVGAATVGAPYKQPFTLKNGPATFKVTNLPPGLWMDPDTAILTGYPTKEGRYSFSVKAVNAAGSSDPVSFVIVVGKLPDGSAGTYQALVARMADVNDGLGARLDLTVNPTGLYTGKLVSGATSLPVKGQLVVDTGDLDNPELSVSIPRPGLSAVVLNLTINLPNKTLSGMREDSPLLGTVVSGWRSTWKAPDAKATAYSILHSFSLSSAESLVFQPAGFGFGSFTVKDTTGAVALAGKLPDGSAFTSSGVLGPQGQVLVYQSLYANKGSLAGVLAVAKGATPAKNTVAVASGSILAWSKPAIARDTLYPNGFGPVNLIAEGGAYVPPVKGAVVMGLENTSQNAKLRFSLGWLDVEVKEFDITFDLLNPAPLGLTNKATFATFASGDNPNKVSLSTVTPATGLFSGDFTLPATLPDPNRKITFQGQIVRSGAGFEGRGYFLLPELPDATSETLANTPKHSGRVIIEALNTVAP